MKILITSFLLTLAIVISVGNNVQCQTNHVILAGKVVNNISNEMKLGNSAVPITKDGNFQFTMEMEKPSFQYLNYEDKKMELFLSQGDSLYITIDAKDFDSSFNVTGINADLNMFLKVQKVVDAKTNQYINDHAIALALSEPINFTATIDSIKQSSMNRLDEFLKSRNNVNAWFVKKNKAEIVFGFNGLKLIYPSWHKRVTGKAAAIDSNYFDIITNGTFNDPELLQVEAYNNYLNTCLDIQAAGKYKYDDVYQSPVNIKGALRYQAIYELKACQEITNSLLRTYFESYIGNYGMTGLNGILTKFKIDCVDDSLKEQVLQMYNKKLQERKEASEIKIYKQVGDIELEAHIFYPPGFKKEDKRPAFLFFHGGGWSTGMPEWGYWDCKKYASKGMVSITFEYRLMDIHGVKIVNCVKDAKSAVYWVRSHANELGIDTGKIVASGFSAGAHLAACTAILDEYEDPVNNPRISCRPNALILGSANYSTENWFNQNAGTNPESISPYRQMKGNMVPTLMFHGTKDEIVSYEKQFLPFIEKMRSLNNKFTYHAFEGIGHFWFRDPKSAEISANMTDEFLASLGYIEQKNK